MSKVRAELRIGEPGTSDNFVLVDCEVELSPGGGPYPWCATDEAGNRRYAASRSAAVLAVFADRLAAEHAVWFVLGGADR